MESPANEVAPGLVTLLVAQPKDSMILVCLHSRPLDPADGSKIRRANSTCDARTDRDLCGFATSQSAAIDKKILRF